MNKKKFVLLLVFIMIVLMGCGEKNEEEQIESVSSETEATVYETVTETIPGLEDSIFDTELQTTEPEETEREVTELDKKEESGIKQPENQATSTKPSSTSPTTPSAKDDQANEPTTKPGTEDGETKNDSTAVQISDYEKFHDMSAAEQQAYIEACGDIDAFFEWYNNAKEEHEAANPPIEVGDGNVDMGDIIGGSN